MTNEEFKRRMDEIAETLKTGDGQKVIQELDALLYDVRISKR